MLEPSRSNLFLNSEPTSNENASGGITYESFNWFLGFSNCIKFGDDSSLRFRYGATVSATTQYTISAFVIMDDLSEPLVGVSSVTGDFAFVCGGVTGGVANENIYYGNNIYRVSTTLTSGTNANNSGIIKYTSQSSKGFRVVGLQIEQGSYATSYIPTQGSAVTRLADTCDNGANEQVINSTEGVLYFEGSEIANDGTFKRISVGTSDNLFANSIQLRYNTADNSITYQFRVGNVYQADITTTINSTNINKIACVWKTNRFEIWINGIKKAEDTSGSVPPSNTFNSLFFGKTSIGLAEAFKGNTKDLRVYNTALTDAQLTALTTI